MLWKEKLHYSIIREGREEPKANNECFQRPIEIKIEQPNIHGKDHSVVQIEDENVHETQVLNSKRNTASSYTSNWKWRWGVSTSIFS